MQHIKDVNVVVYDPNHDLRSLVIGILRDIGFAEIHSTERPDTVQKRMEKNDVDLLIADVPEIQSVMCSVVSDIRHGKLGANPFPLTIGLTSYADENTISSIVNAGFDGLALKPFETLAFRRRVEFFLKQRKPFVTTADYVGPDRRKNPGKPGVDANCLYVPNPAKLIGEGITRDTVKKQIDETAAKLDQSKLISDIGGIAWCAERLNDAVGKEDAELAQRCIQQVNQIAVDIDGRLDRTPFTQVREQSNSLLAVATQLGQSEQIPETVDVEMLGALAETLKHRCGIDQSNAA